MGAQLAALLLAERLATTSDHCSKTGPWPWPSNNQRVLCAGKYNTEPRSLKCMSWSSKFKIQCISKEWRVVCYLACNIRLCQWRPPFHYTEMLSPRYRENFLGIFLQKFFTLATTWGSQVCKDMKIADIMYAVLHFVTNLAKCLPTSF